MLDLVCFITAPAHTHATSVALLDADKQLYKRHCPSVYWSVSPSVLPSVMIELKSDKMMTLDMCVGVGVRVWMRGGRPCPPICEDIETLHYLLKWAQVEVCSSIRLGDMTSQRFRNFRHFHGNNQLWKTVAPKRIKLNISTWAHFKEPCLFFKMSPSWGL